VAFRLGNRWRRFSLWWFAVLIGSYLVLSLPVVANRIADGLPSYQPIADVASLKEVDTLIVLDGDNRRGRVREAKRVFDAVQPRRVIVSGSSWLRDATVEAGIPTAIVGHETHSKNTLEQLGALLQGSTGRVVLIASRLQMPRIRFFAAAMGVHAAFVPSAIDTEPPTSGVRLLIPTYVALRVSRDAMYELAALRYYSSDASRIVPLRSAP
jgi:uncharacterized SAM-binding protein YcdF (DUF218 family)